VKITTTTATTICLAIGVAATAIAGIVHISTVSSGFLSGLPAVTPQTTRTTSIAGASEPQSYTLKIASHRNVASSSGTSSATTPTTATDVTKAAILIHQKINEERASRGLETLSWDPALAKVAADHSRDMAVRNYFSHNDPEGHRYTYRYTVAGYACQRSSGENIYWFGSSRSTISEESLASRAVDAWMHSSGHRHNILNSSFQLEGIGVAFDSSSNYRNSFYVTEDFCARRG
jgi:uncharacterized protein YkwD